VTETTRPRVSIIVLGYNGIEYLEACIGSLLDQDFPGGQYEVVYVDNKSPDASVAFVRERFPGVRIVEFTENYGYAAGNNRALGFVRGELIILLNQDTVAVRSWLRALVAGMDSTPDAVAAHANIIHPWYPDFAGLAKRAEARHAYTPDLTRWGYARYRDLGQQSQPLDVLILSGASLVIRRSVLDELGYLFDEGFYSYGEDWDLGLRIRSLGYRCLLIPSATIYHMYEPKTELRLASLTTTVRNVRNRYLAFYKVMTWPEFIAMSGLLTFGGPLNAFEFGLPRWRQAFFAAALVPTSFFALAAALRNLRRYSVKRREVRRRQRATTGWCLKAIWQEPLARTYRGPSVR